MEFLTDAKIDFLGKRLPAAILSLVLIALCLGSFATRGLNLGVDFTGGLLLEVRYPESADLAQVRSALAEGTFGDAQVQSFGTTRDVLIRLAPREGVEPVEETQQVMAVLQTVDPGAELLEQGFVSSQVGDELSQQGGLALLFAMAMIMIYVWLRFEWKFSVGSVAALTHDIIITVGMFSIFQMTFDLTVLAAVLAVIGYSLNDTIVVFDRIRENFRKVRRGAPEEVMNRSINEMLPRTLITSGTTVVVLLALFFLGGDVIHAFAEALLIGIIVGTYSSIYVASPVALWLGADREDFMEVEKDDHVKDLP